jgi:hypothetical protein
MTTQITIYFLIAWFLMIPLAIFNALLREKVYKLYFTELRSHQLSTFVFIILQLTYTFVFLSIINVDLKNQELIVYGLIWLFLTILFEFGFGHYLMKNTWEKLLNDYNIFKGRLWILVLITIAVSPLLIFSIIN